MKKELNELFTNLKNVEDNLKGLATELENKAIENITYKPTVHDTTVITAMWHVRELANIMNDINIYKFHGKCLRSNKLDEFSKEANFILCKMFVNDEDYIKFFDVIDAIVNAKCCVHELLGYKI